MLLQRRRGAQSCDAALRPWPHPLRPSPAPAPARRRFKSGSVLTLKLGGAIAEQPQGRFSSSPSLPQLCECLRKAALDPRVKGLVVKVDPLAVGWGKLQVRAVGGVEGGGFQRGQCSEVLQTGSARDVRCRKWHRRRLGCPASRPPHAPGRRPLAVRRTSPPQELRRHVEHFRASGKFTIAYLER